MTEPKPVIDPSPWCPFPALEVKFGEPLPTFPLIKTAQLVVFVKDNWHTLMEYISMIVICIMTQGSFTQLATQIVTPLISRTIAYAKKLISKLLVDFKDKYIPSVSEILTKMESISTSIGEGMSSIISEVGSLISNVVQNVNEVISMITTEVQNIVSNPYVTDIVQSIANPIMSQLNTYVSNPILSDLMAQAIPALTTPGAMISSSTDAILGQIKGEIINVLGTVDIPVPALKDALGKLSSDITTHLDNRSNQVAPEPTAPTSEYPDLEPKLPSSNVIYI